MNTNDLIKATEKSGNQISKEKLLDVLKKLNQKEFTFSLHSHSSFVVVIPHS